MPRREPDAQLLSEDRDTKSKGRKRSPARLVAALVVAGFAVAFVVQNHQSVGVHFWFVTTHVHLVWLIVTCVAFGALAEWGIRRTIRKRVQGRLQRLNPRRERQY
ncbi:MAG TPA: LapA family protein [Acidimicrobiales bacterium]|nr:LapA family protein [Acidimicrobiales bacterium]